MGLEERCLTLVGLACATLPNSISIIWNYICTLPWPKLWKSEYLVCLPIGLDHLRYGAHLVEYDTRTDAMVWGLLLARHLGWTTMAKTKTKAKAMAQYLAS
jgi:hypothetical protein